MRTHLLAKTSIELILILAATGIRADQVEMQNGERYLGEVLSIDTNALVLRSEVLGSEQQVQ